jgi:hypothetical protein
MGVLITYLRANRGDTLKQGGPDAPPYLKGWDLDA